MSDSTMYMLYVSVKLGKTPTAAIEEALDGCGWARLRGGEVYLVDASYSARELKDLIIPLLGDKGHIFVCELNTDNRSGYLAASTVEWIKNHSA